MDYGTGAIFGCPAHDQRDFDFAKKYNLEIIKVVEDKDNKADLIEAFVGQGKIINSEFLNGLSISQAKENIINRIRKNENWKKKNSI
jgi:leucyl-tRNA synthetase